LAQSTSSFITGEARRLGIFDITLGSVGGVSTASFYLDGQLQCRAALTADTVLSSGLTLGSGGGGNEFDAYDELAIYPTALSAGAVDRHWTAAASPTATRCTTPPSSPCARTVLADHPAVYYRLDDLNTSSVAYDSSGNCVYGSYVSGDASVPGAVVSEPGETAVETESNAINVVMTSIATGLPTRTVEFWQDYGGTTTSPVVRYGSDFAVGVVPGGVQVSAAGQSVTLGALYDFQYSRAWHLFDITLGSWVESRPPPSTWTANSKAALRSPPRQRDRVLVRVRDSRTPSTQPMNPL
jgi:hypothetical protein